MRPRTDRQRTFRLRDLPLWLAIAIAWLLVRLPLPLLLRIGIGIGWLGDRVAGSRAHIADVNLALCFPELDVRARRALRRRTFRAYGIALVETAIAWLRPVTALSRRTQIDGLEHVRAAQARGHGVLLLGAHFSTLDLAGALLATALRLDITYRRNRNPAIEWLMRQGRARCYDRVHERDDVRAAIRSLREGRVLWYAADQDYGRRHSVFAPFFGVNTECLRQRSPRPRASLPPAAPRCCSSATSAPSHRGPGSCRSSRCPRAIRAARRCRTRRC
jgi:KDO2-lipid IV(A) lauroyltransferase